jgi:hypothetical protein
VLPGRVHEVGYEGLVQDPAVEVRKLLTHCGLTWEPACLEFESNPAPVATASAVQVRRGWDTSGVGRWRKFEPQLGPLVDELQRVGVELHGPG